MLDPYFFFSYARSNDSPYLRKFFVDLAERIKSLSGAPSDSKPDDIGFRDRESIEPGEQWPDELQKALNTSRTMVCLYSGAYFSRPYCGKECGAFLDRLTAHPPINGGGRPPLMLPLLWEHPDNIPSPLPRSVRATQYTYAGFPEIYEKEGLNYVMRVGDHASDYQKLLLNFSKLLHSRLEQYPLDQPYQVPALVDVRSAFEADTQRPAAAAGMRTIHFIFVVGRRDELNGTRKELDYYGTDEKRRDWRPYLGAFQDTVGSMAQDLAHAYSSWIEVVPPSANLVDYVRQAENDRSIVVILVDPWTMKLEKYCRLMEQYDSASFWNAGVVIPWNPDPETTAHEQTLRGAMRKALDRRNGYYRDSILNRESLRRELTSLLSSVTAKVIERAEVPRAIGESQAPPKVEGPGSQP